MRRYKAEWKELRKCGADLATEIRWLWKQKRPGSREEKEAEQLGQLGVDAIRAAGVYYNLNCPLDGEYKIGGNWSETH